MNAQKILAILLIVGGAMALVYGGFSYTSETHRADIGSLHLKVDENERVNIPLWAGVGAVVVGGVLFGFGRKA
jgi:drug/metabolite transporter (DMT)-like permease